jgi:hypothetical protein
MIGRDDHLNRLWAVVAVMLLAILSSVSPFSILYVLPECGAGGGDMRGGRTFMCFASYADKLILGLATAGILSVMPGLSASYFEVVGVHDLRVCLPSPKILLEMILAWCRR